MSMSLPSKHSMPATAPAYETSARKADAELERLEKLATLLDTSFKIPYTDFKVGLDSIIGLVPGVGDLGTGFVSLWIVFHGWQQGASGTTILRMLLNVGLDVFIGLFPLVGDIFDVAWKANVRNVKLLRSNLYRQGRVSKAPNIIYEKSGTYTLDHQDYS